MAALGAKPTLAVATKTDLVGPDRLAQHLMEISRLGDAHDLDWAEIVPVSAVSGAQVDLLRDLLLARSCRPGRRSIPTATSPTSRRPRWSPS